MKIPQVVQPAEFRNKVAVVTGGSDGLGRHLVETLVSFGAHVFFCARNAKKGGEVQKKLGRFAHFVQCDLSRVDEAKSFVERAGRFRGRIDYLVNNAAIDPRIEFEKGTENDFDNLIAINLKPFFFVSQAALPYLKAGRGKAVVNVITTNYMLGLSPFTLYNASKSGIVGLTRSMARELGPLGIRVNAVSPGWIMTRKQLREHVTAKDRKELLAAQSVKFLLHEQHVTPATVFLLSTSSSGITGQNLVVDGGKVMQ